MVEEKEVYRRSDKRAVLTKEQALEFKIQGAITAYQVMEANGFLADHRGGFLIITPPPYDRIVYASSLARQYLGASEEKEVIGMQWFDFIKDKISKRRIRRKLLTPEGQEVRMAIETLGKELSEISVIKSPIIEPLEYSINTIEKTHLYTIARIQRVGWLSGRRGEKLS